MSTSRNISPNYSLGGIVLIAIGAFFLLDSFGILHFGRLISNWWPIILIIVGMGKINSNKPTGVILIVLGIFFLSATLFNLHWDWLWRLWPVVLIAIGIKIIMQGKDSLKNTDASDDSYFSHNSFFGGGEHKNLSSDLKGGELVTIFGGIELDLSEAQPSENCKIICTTIFGGIEIRVPTNWNVIVSGTPLFGSINNRTRPHDDPNKLVTININGTALFGSIEIKN